MSRTSLPNSRFFVANNLSLSRHLWVKDTIIYDLSFCSDDYSAKYGSMIDFCVWIIVLGKFGIAYDTSAMSRFKMLPREGRMKAVKRILSYLKAIPKRRLIIDTTYQDRSVYPVEDYTHWMKFYPDAEEEILNDLHASKKPKARITVYVDADHAHDLMTRRTITGILVMLNNVQVRWISKHQNILDTLTYSSELVASMIATGVILEVRYMLRPLGVVMDGPALMLGNNMSVILSTSVPSSGLKKKHNAMAYH
jgi:hypothetical protein